jgi:hypothetical protein
MGPLASLKTNPDVDMQLSACLPAQVSADETEK